MKRLPDDIKDAWKDVKQDLGFGMFTWKRALYGTAIFAWTMGLVILAVFLGASTAILSRAGSACSPDGVFRLVPESYSYWNRSGTFQITLAIGGNLSFGLAKFIDIAWDVVCSRYSSRHIGA